VAPVAALFGYVVPSLVVFLWQHRRRPRRPRERDALRLEQVPRSPYLPRVLMEYGYWVFLQPVALCRRLGLRPDDLSWASLVLSLAGAVAVGAGELALGGWILLWAFACDAWDGILARQLGTASMAGEFLDATLDRASDLIVGLGLLYYYRNDPIGAALTAAALVGATLVSYTRAKGEAAGVDANVGWMQRHERALYLGLGALLAPLSSRLLEPGVARPRHFLLLGVLGLVALATLHTTVQRARLVRRALRGPSAGQKRDVA
jgi:CDP-diacylglycerol--glycerol-3-phosphate 3-phosphatidyltransferase